jgi:hypothetical protein
VYERVRAGQLPTVRLGGLLRFRPDVLEDWTPPPKRQRSAWTTGYRRTYQSWWDMRRRCSDPKRRDFVYYGARGIKVCERWESFAAFLADMGERPERMSLDRIDVDGDYEPGNCRWAAWGEQRRNRRDSLSPEAEKLSPNGCNLGI